jgi:tetratricopeptide (TPR) repeat protein
VDGETLATRLLRGSLKRKEALELGRDLLHALEAVHGIGIVHRDVKPANIFLKGDRTLLADFGIAVPSATAAQPPTAERRMGTPGYMAPEQMLGTEITPQTDLYAAALVLYEAYTGRRWEAVSPDARPDWSGVPSSVAGALRTGVAWDPHDRWPDARSFRHALWRTRGRRYRRIAVAAATAVAALGLLVGTVVTWSLVGTRPLQSDVAVLPFSADAGLEELAEELTSATWFQLLRFLDVAEEHEVSDWVERHGLDVSAVPPSARRSLRSTFIASGQVELQGSDTIVGLTMFPDGGPARPIGRERFSEDLGRLAVGFRLGGRIVGEVAPERSEQYEGQSAAREMKEPAFSSYQAGRRAFKRNSFGLATEHFEEALRIDSTFAPAAWWFSNAWRWTAAGRPPPVDLGDLLAREGWSLSEIDSLLIAAQLAPGLEERLARYRDVVQQHPRHAYAQFLYAAESQDRGAFVGVTLDTVAARLRAAAEKDSMFAPAFGHLAWSYLKLGRAAEAQAAWEQYARVAAAPTADGEVDQVPLLQFAIAKRFDPEAAASILGQLFQDPAAIADLSTALRLAAMLGVPGTQAEMAMMLLDVAPPAERADLFEARALAWFGLGQIGRALTDFDSAAARAGTPEARVGAAEWRVVPSALGLPGVSERERYRGRRMLQALVDDPSVGARASWALGLHAATGGAVTESRDHLARLEGRDAKEPAGRLRVLLGAVIDGAEGETNNALLRSLTLLRYDSAGRGGDPFARSALHLLRARWLDQVGRSLAADSALRWYGHVEFTGGYPAGPAQAAEVDWALGTFAKLIRGRAAHERGEPTLACRLFGDVVRLWSEADSALQAWVEEAAAGAQESCR